MLARLRATVRYGQRTGSKAPAQRVANGGMMNTNPEQDDLRERVAALMASPLVPIAAGMVFLLAILERVGALADQPRSVETKA